MGSQVGAKQISEERENAIIDMSILGVRQCDIIRHYRIPKSTVSHIIRRRRSCTDKAEAKKRGRKPKLSPRSTRILLACADRNRFKSASFITDEFNKHSRLPLSVRTVQRCLHNNEVNS